MFESPAPSGPWGGPGEQGTGATFASQFGGINPNGTWSLYVITTSGGDGTGSIAGGWSLDITTASASTTTTTLSSSLNPSFTSAPSNSVTLTATVSSTSTVNEGTVAFTDGGATISGCGAQPVSNGQATCNTSFTTEGVHSIKASYSGTSNFGPSSATLSQQVDNHTTVSGNGYCDTGAVTLNNPASPPGDATPYPSHVFVSGLGGTLSNLTVTLKGVSYGFSQDIDALLVGPGGQSADAGPNSNGAVSNVTLTLDDAATSTLSQTGSWGAANASVTSKPFNYGGLNETWGPPAPSGPYGNPGPSGGGTATLANTFDGTNPNGTWSLYVIITGSDGTGSIGGGWCVNTTIQKAALTIGTQVSPASAAVGNATSDTATLGGVAQSADAPTGTVTFNAYGPNDPSCSNTPAFTTAIPLTGAGTSASSGPFTPTSPGSYRWTASYSGDTNYSSQTTSCNDPNETVVVSQASPSLSTTASPSVTIGGAISDAATLSGGDAPSGSITFKLFGPNDATCAGRPLFTSTVNVVNGNGSYDSARFTTTAAGTYNWVVTYSGDANNKGVTPACGAANESVVVDPAATQTKLTSSVNPSIQGQPVTFTATVTGANPTGTVAFKDGSSTLGTGPVGSTLTISRLGVGRHSVIAVFGGDASNDGSTSNTVTQVVTAPARAAPSVSIKSPASGARYRYGQAVKAGYTCSEGTDGPGLRSCTGTVPNGSPIDTRTPGTHRFAVTAVSKDGMSATASVVYTVMPSHQAAVSRIRIRADGTVTFKVQLPGPACWTC